ncbi:MAG TPA: hypothetical protein VGB98_27120 [Pyrinomonadaceae bacterium]
MAARTEDVPRYAYPLAVAAGTVGLAFVYGLADFLSRNLLGRHLADFITGGGLAGTAATLAVAHAAFGALFGMVWPEKTWRWGVWLCAPSACVASLLSSSLWNFLLWEVASLPPACAGAYAAARFHLMYTAVEESG